MHVLVVDDEDTVRRTLMDVVEYAGYEAVGCGNGREAMNHLCTYPENLCLVLLDVMMPQMDGWAVLSQMQQDPRLAAIPVVLMSAVGDLAQSGQANGAVSFLGKPFDIATVLDLINRYCHP